MDLKQKITENLRRIANPKNYYSGTPAVKLPLPENVLIVSRFPGKFPSTVKSTHRRFLLFLSLEGKNSEAIVDGIRYRLNPGEAFLIFPWQYHHFFYEEDFKWLYITFEMNDSSVIDSLRGKVSVIPDSAYEYLQALTGMYKGAREGGIVYASEIILLSALILNSLLSAENLLSSRSEISRGAAEIFVDKVNRYIAGNLDTRLSVKDIASLFSCSESHFRALYRGHMGKSIGVYIAESKLLRAKSLLSSSDMGIAEVASCCGFCDIYSFSRFFHRNADVSPRKFRKSFCD
ncbi:MAG: hypothetical protein A2020_09830 [Lentisphaerae bacterium GWF2_45_14]|nr:MAG: hypothetical protein A2020_09830 [Lentisphaerae bacterium GWF2_45_14]